MAAKDKFHNAVKHALVKDGWTITDDPYVLDVFKPNQEIDFGAEKIIAAERGQIKIGVEVKSFLGDSPLYDFYLALGQYLSYEIGLAVQEPQRILYLAVPQRAADDFERYEAIRLAIQKHHLRLIVFDPAAETISNWKEA